MEIFFNYISDAAVKCQIIHKDETGRVDLLAVYANKQMESITGVSNELILSKCMTDIFPTLNDSVFDWPKIFSEAAMTNESKVIEQYFAVFEKYLRFNIFGYKDGFFDMIITDLTEKKIIRRNLLIRDRQISHLETEIKERASTDMLTRLYNFQFVIDSIKTSIETYNEEGANFCVLLLDVDNFKDINKKYGFKAGDGILQDIGNILNSIARKIDVAGRYGNDRFILVLNNLDGDIAKIMAERAKEELERHFTRLNSEQISISGGLIEFSGGSAEELIIKAEKITEKAKSIGRGKILS